MKIYTKTYDKLFWPLLVLMITLLSNTASPVKGIFASGVILDSMGAVSSGRGGTNISHADNGVLIHDNPAALVNMPVGIRLDTSLELIYPEVRYEDPQNIDYSKHEIFTLPSFSLVYKKHDESKFAFGVGAYFPAGFSTEYHLKHFANVNLLGATIPTSFGDQLYRSKASLMKILFSTSYKINQKFSLGLSIGPSFQKAELEIPHTLQTGQFAGLATLADLDGDGMGLSYSLGMQYKIREETVLGLTFISESKATLRGDARVSIPADAPGSAFFSNLGAEYDLKSNFEWPRSIGFGLSHQVGTSHRFSSDIVWFNWASAFDQIHLKLTEGDNAEFNGVFGPIVNDVLPLNWNDTFAFRFGYEYFYKESGDDIFRFGYIFNDNPIPHSTLVPLIPGITKHNFTFGYSHKWENWEIGGALQFIISDREFVDTSSNLGGDYDNSSVKVKAYDLVLGITHKF